MEKNIEFKDVSFKYPETEKKIFNKLNLDLPCGVISLIGQNGTGKSTLFFLASAAMLPDKGDIFINKINTKDLYKKESLQKYISIIYQNMEFETEDSIGTLLSQVYETGYYKEKKSDFLKEISNSLELNNILNKKLHLVSKGEVQRSIIAFSLLYGSRTILMDEPVFAMEDIQKEKTMDFLTNIAKEKSLNIYYSAHELDLSYKYSDYILFFYKDSKIELGLTQDLFKKEKIEKVYEVPYTLLKKKESIFRDGLKL